MKKKEIRTIKKVATLGLSIIVIGTFVVIAVLQEKEII